MSLKILLTKVGGWKTRKVKNEEEMEKLEDNRDFSFLSQYLVEEWKSKGIENSFVQLRKKKKENKREDIKSILYQFTPMPLMPRKRKFNGI